MWSSRTLKPDAPFIWGARLGLGFWVTTATLVASGDTSTVWHPLFADSRFHRAAAPEGRGRRVGAGRSSKPRGRGTRPRRARRDPDAQRRPRDEGDAWSRGDRASPGGEERGPDGRVEIRTRSGARGTRATRGRGEVGQGWIRPASRAARGAPRGG